MYKTWTASNRDAQALGRLLEAHLNEFADEIVSVAYAVSDNHYVLAVYRALETDLDDAEESAVAAAELIIDEAQP